MVEHAKSIFLLISHRLLVIVLLTWVIMFFIPINLYTITEYHDESPQLIESATIHDNNRIAIFKTESSKIGDGVYGAYIENNDGTYSEKSFNEYNIFYKNVSKPSIKIFAQNTKVEIIVNPNITGFNRAILNVSLTLNPRYYAMSELLSCCSNSKKAIVTLPVEYKKQIVIG